jgi:hypothetical protein
MGAFLAAVGIGVSRVQHFLAVDCGILEVSVV